MTDHDVVTVLLLIRIGTIEVFAKGTLDSSTVFEELLKWRVGRMKQKLEKGVSHEIEHSCIVMSSVCHHSHPEIRAQIGVLLQAQFCRFLTETSKQSFISENSDIKTLLACVRVAHKYHSS